MSFIIIVILDKTICLLSASYSTAIITTTYQVLLEAMPVHFCISSLIETSSRLVHYSVFQNICDAHVMEVLMPRKRACLYCCRCIGSLLAEVSAYSYKIHEAVSAVRP